MSASKALVKRYNKYFSAKNQQSIEGKTITAKVGNQKRRARDLNTLKPEEWLNDNVIDVMTQVLVGRATTELTRKVAVFDTQFTKLILEMPESSRLALRL
jgi:Ulp1 family protease